jgi:hypothetical protein
MSEIEKENFIKLPLMNNFLRSKQERGREKIVFLNRTNVYLTTFLFFLPPNMLLRTLFISYGYSLQQ